MNKRIIAGGIVVAGLCVGTWFGANAALATASQPASPPTACVMYGPPNVFTAQGNYMLWNWNHSLTCPKGTYPVYFSKTITVVHPTVTVTPTVTKTVTVSPSPSVTPTATPTGTATTTAPAT